MRAFIDAFPQLLLLGLGKVDGLLAGRAAAAVIPGGTVGALNKKEVAGLIAAVGMGVGGAAALVTAGNDLLADALSQAIVKDKVLAPELVFQSLFLYGVGIMDDASFQVKDVIETFMEQVGAGFFTANAARAVHDDVLFLMLFQHTGGHGQLVPEGIGGYFQRLVEMSDLVFVMVPHVDDNGVRVVRQPVELLRIHISSFLTHIEGRVIDPVCHDLSPHLYLQHPEGLAVVIHRDVETKVLQSGEAAQVSRQAVESGSRHADLGVDPFGGNVDPTKDLFLLQGYI